MTVATSRAARIVASAVGMTIDSRLVFDVPSGTIFDVSQLVFLGLSRVRCCGQENERGSQNGSVVGKRNEDEPWQ
jgi:hypothetical protein